MRALILFAVVTGLLYAQADRIEGERIRPHVKFLSSDLLEGRGPGVRGGHLAEEYIAAQFAAAGLKPAGDHGTFLQRVPMRLVSPAGESARMSLVTPAGEVPLKWLEDFVATSHSQEPVVAFDAGVVFVGHGIRAPEFGWDDYAGVDVKGKVVVLFTGEPPSDDPKFFAGKALTYYGRWTYKYEEAARQGALGAIIIHTTPTASYGWQVVRGQGRPMPQFVRQPGAPALTVAGWISGDAGGKLLAANGMKVDEALAAADKRGFQARPLASKIRINMVFKVDPIETSNVIGMVAGSDDRLKDEAVFFTAHWDHLGIGAPVKGDSIYNGAIDNGTGSGMLIEMARAWSSMEPKPKRSAYFAAVTSEESGLLGSEYLAAHPPVPSGKIAADLNFDSFSPFGAVSDAGLHGAERTTLWPLVQKTAADFKLELKPDSGGAAGGYFRSDHFSFARTGVPAFSVGMGGHYLGKPASYGAEKGAEIGSHYHQPSDEYSENWDFAGLEQFARFGLTLGMRIANLDRLPTWLKGDEFLPARERSGVK